MAAQDRVSPQLRQVLSWPEGVAFTVAAVLGSGILILPAVTANLAGPGALFAWAAMALLIIPLAIVLGRLATAAAHAGGIAEYVRRAFGLRMGQLTGLLYIGTVPMGAPLAALIGAHYLGPLLGTSPARITALAAALLFVSVVLNTLGVELSGRVAMGAVLAIAAILLAAVATAVPHVHPNAFTPWLPRGWAPVGEDAALLFWAFVGWEMLAHMAEEFRNPSRDVMRAMIVAVAVIDLLYLAVATVTVGTHMYGPGRTATGLAQLVALGLGPTGSWLVGVLAFLIAYGTVHTYVAGFSRLVFAEARIGNLPRWFSHLHPRYQTPTRVLWLQLVPWAIVLAWTYWGHLSLATLVAWPSAIFIALYVLAMLAALRLLPRRLDRVLALIGLATTLGALAFLGWVALYPIGIVALGAWLAPRPSATRASSPDP
jgi:amino acid efflux transporter